MNMGAVSADRSGVQELRFERKFAAPRDKVFAAWTDPALLAGWFGPQEMEIPEVEVDLREGGAWRTVMRNAEGGLHVVGGVYREIDPPGRLSFTWAWRTDGTPGNESLVEIDFADAEGGTLMIFRQSGFESENTANLHNGGWTSTFASLDEFIAGGKIG